MQELNTLERLDSGAHQFSYVELFDWPLQGCYYMHLAKIPYISDSSRVIVSWLALVIVHVVAVYSLETV